MKVSNLKELLSRLCEFLNVLHGIFCPVSATCSLRRISTRRVIQRIRRETELSTRSLSNLLSQWALEKVETNSTFSRRKVSRVALNQSWVQEAVHMSLAFRDGVAGSFWRKRRQNSLQRGNEKKNIRRVNCRGEFAEQFVSWKSASRIMTPRMSVSTTLATMSGTPSFPCQVLAFFEIILSATTPTDAKLIFNALWILSIQITSFLCLSAFSSSALMMFWYPGTILSMHPLVCIFLY